MIEATQQAPAPVWTARAHAQFDLIVYGFATTLEQAAELIDDGESAAARALLLQASTLYREHLFAGAA